MRYVGRFAPSPTGPLHLGSLFTALASYLDAKANDGLWRLRVDDIDAPRAEPGAADSIQRSLEAHGLEWDGSTLYQSQSLPDYGQALEQLRQLDLLFYCRCSRAQLKDRGPYPGSCRAQKHALADAAIRVRCNNQTITFNDKLQGRVRTELGATCGDFVVWRRDGLPAYQLATAVDDGDPGITHVVRGNDLQDITARQIYLMQQLDLQVPHYAHLPVVVDAQGVKLSKRTGAQPVVNAKASANLAAVLQLLTLSPPTELADLPVREMLSWAIESWPSAQLKASSAVRLTERS
ncbi:MAG: tRNA glutamyl-Q(34) synthetase GluQRS [Pseudomonadales bacterium]